MISDDKYWRLLEKRWERKALKEKDIKIPAFL